MTVQLLSPSKLDNFLTVLGLRDRALDVLLPCETRGVILILSPRLFVGVIERTDLGESSLSVNHGKAAVVAVTIDVIRPRLVAVVIGFRRRCSNASLCYIVLRSYVVVIIYRPGSTPVTAIFSDVPVMGKPRS